MLGAIIGDIAGSRFEFANTSDYNFEMFHKDCDYTDDTICTVAIADAELSGKSYKDALVEWCQRYPTPMGGYGARFMEWIFGESHEPYGSWGNGAAMRVSPVAWLYDDGNVVYQHAIATALVSHDHRYGILGARDVAMAIFYLRTLKSKKPVGRMLVEFYRDEIVNLPQKGEWCDNCQGCVPLAFNIFLQSESFEDAIRRAVSYGGDSDTLAAIVGSLAEAYYGIPEDFKAKALSYLPEDIKEVIKKFYDKIQK